MNSYPGKPSRAQIKQLGLTFHAQGIGAKSKFKRTHSGSGSTSGTSKGAGCVATAERKWACRYAKPWVVKDGETYKQIMSGLHPR